MPFDEWRREFVGHYFPMPLSELHVALRDELSALHERRPQWTNWIAPRGNGKSVWTTFAYPLWCVLEGIEPYVILSADTGDQSKQYVCGIRDELENNAKLRRAYPQAVNGAKTWREDKLALGNGCVVQGLSTGKKIRGRREGEHRPSLIVVDDPENNEHVISPLQRSRSWDWLTKDVCNAGSPITNIICVGTALHEDCIVMRLQSTPGWRSRVFRSIIEWPRRMDLWQEWELILRDVNRSDEERERDARAFYEERQVEMEA